MKTSSIGAVIATLGRPDLLRQSATAILADDRLEELIVVIDGSDGPTESAVDALRSSDTRVRAIALGHNVGRSPARQIGVENTTAEIVLLLDDDVIAGPGLATAHAARHSLEPDLVLMGYMPVTRSTDVFSRLYAREYESAVQLIREDPQSVSRRLWGGNVSMHRSDALRVGLVSPGFEETYFEDQDLGSRCADAGLHVVFDESLYAAHLPQRDWKGFLASARSMGRGAALIEERHGRVVGGNFDASHPHMHSLTVALAIAPESINRLINAGAIGVAKTVGPLRMPIARMLRRIAFEAGKKQVMR